MKIQDIIYGISGPCPSSGIPRRAQRFGTRICFRPHLKSRTFYSDLSKGIKNHPKTQVAQPFVSRHSRLGNSQQFHTRMETDSVSGKCAASRKPAGLIVHFVRVPFSYWFKLLTPASHFWVGFWTPR